MRRILLWTSAALALWTAACTPFYGQACTADYRYGLSISVVDDAGDPVCATVTIVDGAYEEVSEEFECGTYVGAGERAGTYDITVEAEGYATQTIDGIVVDNDECHVIGESVDVVLAAE